MHDMEEAKRQWGRNIQLGRKLVGLKTQAALADVLGVSQGTVARWEAGFVAPTDAHKSALAAVLHQEVRQLFPLFAVHPVGALA